MTLSAGSTEHRNEATATQAPSPLMLVPMEAAYLPALTDLVLTAEQRAAVATPHTLVNQAENEGCRVMVIKRHDRPVGMFGYAAEGPHGVHLFDLQIALTDQNQGIGCWALRTFVQHLKEETETQQIRLRVPKSNLVAAAFFVSEGFRVTLPPQNSQDTAWHMVLNLT
ncbi:GNAT family N-acetyltransferase [Acanthopleuribacter pedis]|uniref:GNAT family N-acetyltransferase n=1 Tax=Acanthopleuribacter pedis TaxID=442870 RepID=A0A8J7U5R0_9BACT|nr:GNAT family N-acetyltransferase [Acanthopleuribacter pedis]MBO1321977.1 GNAT family N-acetyltransferase [Acanthopleuribacter pedis]